MQHAKLLIAGPMEAGDIQRLEEGFGRLVGEPVSFEVTKDDSLLGGFSALVGGRVYDMSLRTQLKALRKYVQKEG